MAGASYVRTTPDGEPLPPEADWEIAPGVIEGSQSYELTPETCDIEYWTKYVVQGSLQGIVRGRRPEFSVPDFLREPGHPLRENLIMEFAFRSMSEDYATRGPSYLIPVAPTNEERDFFATQVIDEARHSMIFRKHLLDLDVPEDELDDLVESVAGADRDRILQPIWDWVFPDFNDDYIAGVVILTVLLEGVLAPTTELSERKWRPISTPTADVERGACVDEIRHLAVGSYIVKRHLERHPEDLDHVLDVITQGRDLWASLPTPELVFKRESLFQEGMELIRDQIGDYEIEDGIRLVDTTAEQRMMLALDWSREVQDARLRYMGLEAAIPQEAKL
ncbi:MAG TPA: hypothetical protein VF712_06540 [Thermoleophilaceae bacterium]|jgi:hypothetical protein